MALFKTYQDELAQLGHWGWGGLVVVSVAGPTKNLWLGVAAAFLFAAVKEFRDWRVLKSQPLTGALRDFGFFAIGILQAAVCLLRLFRR